MKAAGKMHMSSFVFKSYYSMQLAVKWFLFFFVVVVAFPMMRCDALHGCHWDWSDKPRLHSNSQMWSKTSLTSYSMLISNTALSAATVDTALPDTDRVPNHQCRALKKIQTVSPRISPVSICFLFQNLAIFVCNK